MLTATAADLRPSSAGTWLVCGGSVLFRRAFPELSEDGDSDVTEDGTACHWLAAEVREGRFHAEGSLSPNHRELTDEMFEAVDLWQDTLNIWTDVEWYCERKVQLDFIYPQMSGTPDAWAYRPGHLRVADLKFGFRFVEVWNNVQLSIYALGIGWQLGLPDSTKVELLIVQPRANHREGPVRTWITTLGQLRITLLPRLQEAARHALSGDPECVVNPGCINCPGAGYCESFHNASWGAVEMAYQAVPHHLDNVQIGRELTMLEDAERKIGARIAALKVQADAAIRTGNVVPGWDLQASFARERWQSPELESAIQSLAEVYHQLDISKPRRAITPNQARKAGVPSAIVAMFAHRPSTGVKLVKQDPLAARKAFEQNPIDRTDND